MQQHQFKLTYFDTGGRAEQIRLAFHVGGIKFIDERLSKEDFILKKQAGEFKYGQVPVLEVDGKQFAQTGALFRYASQVAGLYPSDELQKLQLEEYLFSFDEIQGAFINTLMIQGEEEKKTARINYLNNVLLKWLDILNKSLENNKSGWYIGDKLTAADLMSYLLVGWLKTGGIEHIPNDVTNPYQNLEQNYEKVKALEQIQSWNSLHPPKQPQQSK